MLLAAAALQLMILHRLDGGQVLINPAQITHLHDRRQGRGNQLLHDSAHCAIGLVDGKVIAVRESCEQVRRMLGEGTK